MFRADYRRLNRKISQIIDVTTSLRYSANNFAKLSEKLFCYLN